LVIEELRDHLAKLGYSVDRIQGSDGQFYIVIRSITIPKGTLSQKQCDVAILWTNENPWVPQAAIHTRPILVPIGTQATQQSAIGPEWQYWSRRFDHSPTPKRFLAHVLTILGEV
jgi:hypothetical protein